MTIKRPIFPRRRESVHTPQDRLAAQHRERKMALLSVLRRRKEARAEIDRLIAFLDATEVYVTAAIEYDADPNLKYDAILDSVLESWKPIGAESGKN